MFIVSSINFNQNYKSKLVLNKNKTTPPKVNYCLPNDSLSFGMDLVHANRAADQIIELEQFIKKVAQSLIDDKVPFEPFLSVKLKKSCHDGIYLTNEDYPYYLGDYFQGKSEDLLQDEMIKVRKLKTPEKIGEFAHSGYKLNLKIGDSNNFYCPDFGVKANKPYHMSMGPYSLALSHEEIDRIANLFDTVPKNELKAPWGVLTGDYPYSFRMLNVKMFSDEMYDIIGDKYVENGRKAFTTEHDGIKYRLDPQFSSLDISRGVLIERL